MFAAKAAVIPLRKSSGGGTKQTAVFSISKYNVAIVFAGLLLTGCSAELFTKQQRVQGPVPVIDSKTFERVDLITELTGDPKALKDPENLNASTRLALAYKKFYENVQDNYKGPKHDDAARELFGKKLRNRVQGRLIQASDQACGVYFNFLRQFETEGEFGLGFLATALAGAGAIVTRADTARLLSGLAGIAEGTRAEFRQAFFSNLATHVIIPGIENRRRVILEGEKNPTNTNGVQFSTTGILKKWDLSLHQYPVETAIKDAVFYHAHCNLMAGLVESSDLIQLGKRPGLKALNLAFADMQETHRLITNLSNDTEGIEATKDTVTRLLAEIQKLKTKVDAESAKAKEKRAEIEKPFVGDNVQFAAAVATFNDAVDGAKSGFADVVTQSVAKIPAISGEIDTIESEPGTGINADQKRKLADLRARARVIRIAVDNAYESLQENLAKAIAQLEAAATAVAEGINEPAKKAAEIAVQEAANTGTASAAVIASATTVKDEARSIDTRQAAMKTANSELAATRSAHAKAETAILAVMAAVKALDSAQTRAAAKQVEGLSDKVNNALKAGGNAVAEALQALEAYRKKSVKESKDYIATLKPAEEKDKATILALAEIIVPPAAITDDAAQMLPAVNEAMSGNVTLQQAVAVENVIKAAKSGT